MRHFPRNVTSVIFAVAFVLVASVLLSDTSFAATIVDGANAARGDGQPGELFGDTGIITTIVNILLFIVGSLSVIMLIFGGLRYVVSAGNATAVTAAKNTILYAIVGLIIAFLAYAAVNFILSTVAPGSGSGFGGSGTNV